MSRKIEIDPHQFANLTRRALLSSGMGLGALAAGKLLGGAIVLEILRQLGWLVFLTALARAVAAIARRRVVIQGG